MSPRLFLLGLFETGEVTTEDGTGFSSGMEEIRTGGAMECLCPNTSFIRMNRGQLPAVTSPLSVPLTD
uniref:Uncharacterized protein n=1 Tax=Anguilla anguilla TaxID=7936 RepID=A0A0E9QUF9_ANGAN